MECKSLSTVSDNPSVFSTVDVNFTFISSDEGIRWALQPSYVDT